MFGLVAGGLDNQLICKIDVCRLDGFALSLSLSLSFVMRHFEAHFELEIAYTSLGSVMALVFVQGQEGLRALMVESGDIIPDLNNLGQWDVSNDEEKLKGCLQKMTIRSIDSTMRSLGFSSRGRATKDVVIRAFMAKWQETKVNAELINIRNQQQARATAQSSTDTAPSTIQAFSGAGYKLSSDELTLNSLFRDMRASSGRCFDGFKVQIDPNLSVSSLGVKILEGYNSSDSPLQASPDLSRLDFKQCLYHGMSDAPGSTPIFNPIRSLRSHNIMNGDFIEMQIYNEDDARYIEMMIEAMGKPVVSESEDDNEDEGELFGALASMEWEAYLQSPADFYEDVSILEVYNPIADTHLGKIPIDKSMTTVGILKGEILNRLNYAMTKAGKGDYLLTLQDFLVCSTSRSMKDLQDMDEIEGSRVYMRLRGGGLVRKTVSKEKKTKKTEMLSDMIENYTELLSFVRETNC